MGYDEYNKTTGNGKGVFKGQAYKSGDLPNG